MNPYDLHGGHLTFIINQRIKQYNDDIVAVTEFNRKHKVKEDIERIEQDQVIIQEVEKILYGRDLEFLSFV